MNTRTMPRTALTIYLAHNERTALPPAPILVDEHFFVRSGLDQPGARLIGFSAPGQIAVTVWGHHALQEPESTRALQPTFLIAGRVWRHPIAVADLTVRQSAGVIQVVITGPAGKRYRPYLGDDPAVADRIATSWGSQPGYTATIQQISPAR